MKILYFIFSSSLLIGLVLVIRKLFRKKLSPVAIYALWLIPLVRLMAPFALWEVAIYGTAADILNAPYRVVSEWLEEKEQGNFVEQIESENTTAQLNDSENAKVNKESIPIAETKTDWTETQITMTTTPVPVQASDTMDIMEIIQKICCGIWILGSIVVSTYTLFINRKWYEYVKAAPNIDCMNGVPVYLNDDIVVPCLTGVIQPKILVNNEVRNNTQLYESILQHEITHFKQKDHIWTAIKIFICVIYWWNPLVWVASIYAGEDAELACDARVLKGKSKEERKAYGYSLLQLLENTQKNRKIMYATTSMSGSHEIMKRRIEEIASETKTGKTFLIFSILILGAVFILGCAVPVKSRSLLETAGWEIVDQEEGFFQEAEYSYELQNDIRSGLIYYEIYEYGEVTKRSILSCSNIEEPEGNIKIRNEISKNLNTDGKENWIVEFNGIGIELEKPIYDYDTVGHSSTALNDEKAIEIKTEDDWVLIADFGGKQGETSKIFDCKQLSVYKEEELQENLKDNYVVVLLRFVVSQKEAQELYDTYAEKEVAADGNTENSEIIYSEDLMENNKVNTEVIIEENSGIMNSENEEVLEFNVFLDAVANNSIEQTDWGSFSNVNREFFDDYSLNHYISYDLEYENQKIRLDFSYMKEDNQLSNIYLVKENDSILWIYDYDEEKQRVSEEEIVEFIKRDDNILNEISFELPEGLSMSEYSADKGYEGGCLFLPMVYEGDEEFTLDFWMASGMVSRYTQSAVLKWDGNKISDLYPYFNHSSKEVIEQVEGLCAPALLVHYNHDLYTAGELGRLEEEQGVDISTLERTSDYWYLFIAQPEEEYGYVVTLNQKNFTKEDILNLGKTIDIIE